MPDIQTCLPHATADEVRRVSAQLLEATGAGLGGMIADTYSHWPVGIPPENITAWQDVVAAWPVAESVNTVEHAMNIKALTVTLRTDEERPLRRG